MSSIKDYNNDDDDGDKIDGCEEYDQSRSCDWSCNRWSFVIILVGVAILQGHGARGGT